MRSEFCEFDFLNFIFGGFNIFQRFRIFTARCYASAAYVVMRCLLSVCVSVCLLRLCILSKRINISSEFFHHRVAKPF